MIELSDIIKFVEDKTGADIVLGDSDIADDLGIDGDDFDDFIIEFAKQFSVDISPCLWYFHCSEEGSWNSIGGAFIKSPDKRVEHIPVTPIMLCEFAKEGRWNIEYPKHKIPRARFDMLINQLLLTGALCYLLYRWIF
jgi:hypothetical protein